jgi:hypothetical protein
MFQKQNKTILAGLIIVLFFCGSMAIWAKNNNHTFKILQPTRVGQTTLTPGEYSLQISDKTDSAELSFYKDGKLAGQATAQIVKGEKNYERNQIITKNFSANETVLTGLGLKGDSRTFRFMQD